MRAPEMPCVRWRNRSAMAPALSSRWSHRFSGRMTQAGVEVGAAAEAAGAHQHTRAHCRARTSSMAIASTCAQLAVEILRCSSPPARSRRCARTRGLPAARVRSASRRPANGNAPDEQHHEHAEQRERAADDPQRPAAGDGAAQARGVAIVEIVEHAVDAAGHARLRHAVGEQLGAHHRRQ